MSFSKKTEASSVTYNRCSIDLETGLIEFKELPCRNLEEVVGGFGRSFQLLGERDIKEAYSSDNPLVLNTGLLTGTGIMTGLRTYFSAYSPLKHSNKGLPAAMWSAASGKFGSKLKWTGIDEVVFENRSSTQVYVVLSEGENGPCAELKPAGHLSGLTTHQKIMALQKEYPDAHFAAIGPAGENYQSVHMGAVALSTENQLKSGEDKCRFAGRGGMGSIMGYKNLLAIVAQSKDAVKPITSEVRNVNRVIMKGGGSTKYQPVKQGGGGGTWANYEVLQAFYAVPENNFRPKGNRDLEALFPENVAKVMDIRSEACFRCGIRCHNNLHRKMQDGAKGGFVAKFDYEPLDLFGANLGILDGEKVASLVKLCDNLGMDAISLPTTISYILDYNERHSDNPMLNGAKFGEYEKIKELVIKTGLGQLKEVGQGVKRLSRNFNETAYANHVKGLELPGYLPETNPGYAWSIAGGHMSMGTALSFAKDGNTNLDYWVKAITDSGVLQVGYDMIGLCKFIGLLMNHEMFPRAIKAATGLEVSSIDLETAIRRAYFRGLALERKQGYEAEEYTLPSQVFDNPNPNVKLPHFITRDFFTKLEQKVWEVFDPHVNELLDEILGEDEA